MNNRHNTIALTDDEVSRILLALDDHEELQKSAQKTFCKEHQQCAPDAFGLITIDQIRERLSDVA